MELNHYEGSCQCGAVEYEVDLNLDNTKLESTVRYLGIEVDDAIEMAELTEA